VPPERRAALLDEATLLATDDNHDEGRAGTEGDR